MLPAEHLKRAKTFEASAEKLDPLEDAALHIIFLMRAGTHRVNAALHLMGVTDTEPSANRLGDLNHSYKPRLEGDLPSTVALMFKPLSFIENLRPDYVRGSASMTQELATQCRRAYDEIVMHTAPILAAIVEDSA